MFDMYHLIGLGNEFSCRTFDFWSKDNRWVR